MVRRVTLNKQDTRRIDRTITMFREKKELFQIFSKSLVGHLAGHPRLTDLIHFIKWRVKDIESLRGKLERKTIEEKTKTGNYGSQFIDETNLFDRVPDLAGVRILHLHTEQMRDIHTFILEVIDEHHYKLARSPVAHCWDVEYERIFRDFGIETESRESMYTTVHYDIVANQRTRMTCELQVRSLMDEVWSEVSHRISYPTVSTSETCRDQLKVLARLTTGGTRLVDSIFKTHRGTITGDRIS